MTPKQRLAMDAPIEVLLKKGQPALSDYCLPTGTTVVIADDWKTELFRRNVLDPDGKNPHARYNVTTEGLRKGFYVAVY
jgi:hypothetical protein